MTNNHKKFDNMKNKEKYKYQNKNFVDPTFHNNLWRPTWGS